MLHFFRKHQRFFFSVVAVVVIASFCFFGTSGISKASRQVDQTVLYKMLDGSKLTRDRLDRMVQFLSHSHFDFLDDRIASPNWLNSGVIETDFLQVGLGKMVAERILPLVQKDVTRSLCSVAEFSSYRHPRDPFLTAEAVWSQFVPESKPLLSEIRTHGRSSGIGSFSLLTQLYLQQKAFPSLFCKRMLQMQERQEKGLFPDEGIPYADVSLSGLHSLEDFFGMTYLKSVAQVILQGAAQARAMGIEVSLQEAREELLNNLRSAATRVGREFPANQLYPTFLQVVQGMGMDEAECLSLWKDVILFRKYLSSGEAFAQVDNSSLQEFYDFAHEQAEVECFSLPAALQIKDFFSLLQLQAYIEAVSSSKDRLHKLSFPQKFLSPAEVEKKLSGLVHRDCVLEYAMLDVKKEAALLGTKEVWEWEQDCGWDFLVQHFSFLQEKKETVLANRFSVLEQLEEKQRDLVDQFSREKMITLQDQKLKNVLQAKEKSRVSCSFGSSGEGLVVQGIHDKKTLASWIQAAALDETAREKLEFYSEDGRHFYSIRIVKLEEEPRILTFAEAEKSEVLKNLINKKLEGFYPEMRKKNTLSYLRKDGTWEPLVAVREKVALAFSSDLARSIQEAYKHYMQKEPTEEEKTDPHFYVQHRMLLPMQECIAKEKSDTRTIVEVANPLLVQWELIRETKKVTRSNKDFFPEKDSFLMPIGAFSTVQLDKPGFFRLLSREKAQKISSKESSVVKRLLLQEMQQKMMGNLLDSMQSTTGFSL